jgi:hypothetical protein
MNKKLFAVLFAAALFFLSAFTNPTQEQYIDWAVQSLKEDRGILFNLGTDYLAKPIVNSSTKTKDFLFFSIFETSFTEKYSTKTIGFFNVFLTLNKEKKE